jgi:2-polyprenyl-6-methoxyphenol hydroxylase-like FAD-dependent oxidoreductase
MGGGVAGQTTALMLARDGHRVLLLERDGFELGPVEVAETWSRKGIPHFLQPHAFIPRGRAELKDSLTDVYAALIEAGAHDIDVRRKLPGPVTPQDEVLQYMAVRRPVIEWALRRAVRDEPGIEVRAGVRVTGLSIERGRVAAVAVDGADVTGDLVVDALGRRSPAAEWLQRAGMALPDGANSDCGVIYYSRYYRQRPGFDLPDGPWFLSPRGDLGYMAYASFPGDNGTFAAVLAVPTGVPQWRVLRDARAFETAVARIPALAGWADPAGVDPITDVMPMAGLRNSLRADEGSLPVGLVLMGDALCHTDPVLAHGLAFALIHARELATALRHHTNIVDASAGYAAATAPWARERYDFATALDEQRLRHWVDAPVDYSRADGDYALFSMMAAGAVAPLDPDVFRVFIRRIGLLDSTAVLDTDADLQSRIERLFQQVLHTPRQPPGPPKDEMIELIGSVTG